MAEKKKGILGLLSSLASSDNTKTQTVDKKEIASGQPYLPKVGHAHNVAGLFYREENAWKLAKENPNFKLSKDSLIKKGYTNFKIFKYAFQTNPVELIQEPDNPHDSHAIKVVVAGQHIGYIKAGSCARVNKLINENRIEKIFCRISGGPFKSVYVIDNEDSRKKPKYEMEDGTIDLRAEIRIVESK